MIQVRALSISVTAAAGSRVQVFEDGFRAGTYDYSDHAEPWPSTTLAKTAVMCGIRLEEVQLIGSEGGANFISNP